MAECSICASPQLDAINAALAGGATVREVAGLFSVSKSSVHRHATACVPLAQAQQNALARVERKDAQVLTTTVERLVPLDGLASSLMDFITKQVQAGKMPNLSLCRTWLAAQEVGLKAAAVLEQRSGPPRQVSGLTEASRTVAYLSEHHPDALAALRAHLEAVA